MLHRFAASHTGQGVTLFVFFGVVVVWIGALSFVSLIRWGAMGGRPVPADLQVRRRRWVSLVRPATTGESPAGSRGGGALFAGRRSIHRRRGSPPGPGTTRGRRRTAAP